MVFILTTEMGGLDDTWGLDAFAALEALTHASFRGSHILAIEAPEVAVRLLALPKGDLGIVARAVLQRALSNFAFQGALFNLGVIVCAVAPVSALEEAAKRWARVLGLPKFVSMSLEPTLLLAENVVDAKVFLIAAQHHMVVQRLKGLRVSATPRGGGGSTIGPELAQVVQQGRQVCLAITDSDERWPGATMSTTSRRCEEFVGTAAHPVGHARLTVRELENLIPFSVAIEIAEGEVVNRVEKLQALNKNLPDVRRFCDIKDGVVGAKIFRLGDNTPERFFLFKVLQIASRNQTRCLREEDCVKERNLGSCSCEAVPRVGELGARFLGWLESRSAQKALESFSGEWRDSWLSAGAVAFAWCCAPSPTRA